MKLLIGKTSPNYIARIYVKENAFPVSVYDNPGVYYNVFYEHVFTEQRMTADGFWHKFDKYLETRNEINN